MTDYFDHYMFTSNATNFVCPVWLFGNYDWGCSPPNACATDPSTTKQYCCDAGDICWAPPSVCAGDGSTFTCSSSSTTWCCLKNKEACTQSVGQINICWSLAHDTLTNISSSVLNGTYSSLSSAQPSASSYTFDPLTLIAQTQTASTRTTSTQTTSTQTTSTQTTSTQTTSTQTTSTQTATATNSTGPSNDNPSPNTLSGGAIAGIVIGVVAAIAIACLATFLLVRHWQKKQNQLAQAAMSQADPKYTQLAHEFHGDSRHIPQEMQADTAQVTELPGT